MKHLLTLVFLTANFFIFGQINVGPKLLNVPQSILGYRQTDFNPTNLKILKNSTTYFVYRESDKDHLPDLKKQLTEAWKLNDLKFLSFDQYVSSPLEENASYFTISGLFYSQGGVNSLYLYLTLNMVINGENQLFSRIDLHPNYKTMYHGMYAKTEQERSDFITLVYSSTSKIYNWNTLFLKNSLQFISSKLEKEEQFWMFEENEYTNMSVLKTKTLYIPDYALIRFRGGSGDESDKHNPRKLLDKYPFSYKILPIEELERLVEESEEPVYYLSYVRCNIDKYVTIFEANTGEMFYYNYTKTSYNLKDDDFKKLKKAIKKGK